MSVEDKPDYRAYDGKHDIYTVVGTLKIHTPSSYVRLLSLNCVIGSYNRLLPLCRGLNMCRYATKNIVKYWQKREP